MEENLQSINIATGRDSELFRSERLTNVRAAVPTTYSVGNWRSQAVWFRFHGYRSTTSKEPQNIVTSPKLTEEVHE